MVAFDEHMIQAMNALATDEPNRQIIPIVGMGGIGKTTLARNVFSHPYILEYFYIRAWVTISQEYNARDILLDLLRQINNKYPKDLDGSEDQLGELLHEDLFGRKYLIAMNDMWDIQVWDDVKRFLPPNNNGSRILITTRLSKLAGDIGSCSPHQIGFLDEENSMDLLCQKVFGKEDCPIELENIGRSIAKRCGGLPLALVVIGGLLAKSGRTKEYWEFVEGDVTSVINDGNDEHIMKILSLSYSHLPIYLKPCFLYLAVFPEDYSIRVSKLIRLWVAEGFIRPTMFKSLEEVAEEFLRDLIDRNLILVRERGRSGNAKFCSIHDLIRDLCKREAQKNKFLRIVVPKYYESTSISAYLQSERRLCIHHWRVEKNRSLLSYSGGYLGCIYDGICNLLRVLDAVEDLCEYDILNFINSRYVAKLREWGSIPSSLFQFWNLQTLVICHGRITLPAEIWEMPQLRHLGMAGITLPDPPQDGQNITVLENLQTLSTVVDFVFADQVVERIPNLKKLGIYCHTSVEIGFFCLNNLARLHKLGSLALTFDYWRRFWGPRKEQSFSRSFQRITFPRSLRKLCLSSSRIPWENMSVVGSLPNLEVLKLLPHAARGREWNPIEGEFGKLKFLMIEGCELERWGADNTHFPSLVYLRRLQFPLEISQGYTRGKREPGL